MKVCMLTASVSQRAGGVFDGVRRLAQSLRAAATGLNVSVFGLQDPDTERDLPSWDGIPVFAGRVAGPRAFGYCPKLLRTLREETPDLLHVHGLWMYPSVACLRWAAEARRPYIVSAHGMLDGWALRKSAWKKRLAACLYENRHLRGATCLHALTGAEAQAIRGYGLPNPICVIPNGVDLPGDDGPAPPWANRIPENARVLFYLGRLHPKKALPNLLRAWATLKPEVPYPAWRLVVAGWDQGSHAAELRRLSEELALSQAVHFVGPQFGPEKASSFRRADAFILPSHSEGLPVSVLEAWSYALPVLMTAQCNLSEGFGAGAAIRIEPDPASIAAGLRKMFAMPSSEWQAMGDRGRLLVAERFSWPKIAMQMKGVYDWVLGGGPKPACITLD